MSRQTKSISRKNSRLNKNITGQNADIYVVPPGNENSKLTLDIKPVEKQDKSTISAVSTFYSSCGGFKIQGGVHPDDI